MPLPYSMNARQPRGMDDAGCRAAAGRGRSTSRSRGSPAGAVSGGLSLRAHVVVAVDLDEADLAELAFLDDPVAGLDEVRRAAALRADLHDAAVLAGGGEHRLALDHVHADRLLHVDVGPGLDGGDHGQRVPVVGRGDEDDVEVLLGEHLRGSRRRSAASSSRPGARPPCRRPRRASCWSTSQSETTSTGATWIRRKRSHLPYQPEPIRPTRLAG